MEEVRLQIISVREMRNMSQEQLANLTGLSLETIRFIESGMLDPNLSTLVQICSALKCKVEIGNCSI